jgi:hypothetical protein
MTDEHWNAKTNIKVNQHNARCHDKTSLSQGNDEETSWRLKPRRDGRSSRTMTTQRDPLGREPRAARRRAAWPSRLAAREERDNI